MRFGKEFITEANPLYSIGPGRELSPDLLTIPQIAKNLNRTDNGINLHDLNMKVGRLLRWFCGRQGTQLVG